MATYCYNRHGWQGTGHENLDKISFPFSSDGGPENLLLTVRGMSVHGSISTL